ncbi:MAG: hypothetical protein ACLPXW_22150 [Xanthobacteraceae bacterium]
MAKYDVTKLNVAIDKLLTVTENPRHRFLLQAYSRHRYLEVAGRYEEIFAPEMMSPNPCYHFQAEGMRAKLEGQEAVKSLYRLWADTNQSIFYVENEQVAVADNFIASIANYHQQLWGRSLTLNNVSSYLPGFLSDAILKKVLATQGMRADENAMYFYSSFIEMVWPYDDRGRLIGEDVWEPDPDKATIVKLDPADVLTTAESVKLLNPLIKPLPSFDEMVLGKTTVMPMRA